MFPITNDIKDCLTTLQKGGLILYPTDTVWGIGCDATHQEAVQKIFELKKRADSKSMIVLLENESNLPNYVASPEQTIFDYLKGVHSPTTVIYPRAINLPKNLVAEDGSIAIRICKDPFCKQLLSLFGKPIVSTSANISGYPTPNCFQDIAYEILQGVDYVVNHRQEETEVQKSSSIIKWDEQGKLIILRP